jgi:hypothetical protein
MTYLNRKRKLFKTSLDKTNSSYQKEINRLEKFCTMYCNALISRKKYQAQTALFIIDMLAQGKITREDLKPYFPKKRDSNL